MRCSRDRKEATAYTVALVDTELLREMSESTETIVAHTPGPWHIDRNPWTDSDRRPWTVARGNPVFGEDDIPVADIFASEADARLIAAAPTMYEALKEIVRTYIPMEPPAFVTAAIAKAEGQQP